MVASKWLPQYGNLNSQDNLHWLTVLHQGQFWQLSEPPSLNLNSKFLGEGMSLSREDSGANCGSRKLQSLGAGLPYFNGDV